MNSNTVARALSVVIALSVTITSARAQEEEPGKHRGQLGIGVETGFTPVRIAVPEFKIGADRAESIKAAGEIHDVIVADLEFTGLFQVIDPAAYRDLNMGDPSAVVYEKWDLYNAQGVATGRVGWDPAKELYVEARLFDIKAKAQVFAKEYTGGVNLTRKIGHIVAQLIIETFWGKGRGFATSHVTFISDRTGNKEIWAMDYDGENQKQLTSSRFLNLTPACSPDGRSIAYTAYKKRNPDLYLMDLKSGDIRLLRAAPSGQSMSPDWSPDGKSIIFTASSAESSGTTLWMIDADGTNLRQITSRTRGVDCSPAFSTKTGEVVFTSDRSGSPQIYRMDQYGANQSRVPVPGDYNDAASFSPDNTKIAYQSRTRGNAFDIYVFDVASGESTRVVDPSGSNENPAWSPDGRFLVFSSSRTGKFQLFMVKVTGGAELVKLTQSGHNQTPCFCP